MGSNSGDSDGILHHAATELGRSLSDMRVSSLYRTKPLYVTDQDDFLNIVVSGFTNLDPYGFLEVSQRIETAYGRRRELETAKGPRTLDIDILLFGTTILATERLVIPHPGIGERGFVLVPLIELEPGLRDPLSGASYAELLGEIGTAGVYPEGPFVYTP